MSFEDDHLDVLQNIEFAIVREFQRDRALLDIDVAGAVQALARYYDTEDQGRAPSEPRLGERSRRVFDAMKAICDYRLGRAAAPPGTPVDTAEMVACLKRIRKSVERWTREAGRQGYLNFVNRFIV